VDVTGEELAVGGQRESPVWSGAQQGGADGGLELADLAGEVGVPDAEPAGCVVEAGLAGEGEEPSDALLGAGVGEDVPDVRGERSRPLLVTRPTDRGGLQPDAVKCPGVVLTWMWK
jgi:hypothetical protein